MKGFFIDRKTGKEIFWKDALSCCGKVKTLDNGKEIHNGCCDFCTKSFSNCLENVSIRFECPMWYKPDEKDISTKWPKERPSNKYTFVAYICKSCLDKVIIVDNHKKKKKLTGIHVSGWDWYDAADLFCDIDYWVAWETSE